MSKNTLDELFSSRIRVKILKFFFRNYPSDFDIRTLSVRLQELPSAVKREMAALQKIGLIRKKS